MWNKTHKYARIILGVILFGIISILSSVQPVSATRIPKSQLEKAAVFESIYTGYVNGAPTQGGVVTKNYYVFSDCKGRSAKSCTNGYVKVYNRNNCSMAKKIKTKVRNIKGVYYGWGKKNVTFIGYGGGMTGCLTLSNLSFRNDGKNCTKPPTLNYVRGGTSQGAATSYNGYKYKVAGYGDNGYSYLKVSGKGKTKEYEISNKDIKSRTGLKPKYGFEPQGVSVDGDTGDVYISYAYRAKGGHRMILFLRIKSSYFKSFTGKSGSSSYPVCKNSKQTSGSSSSSSSSNSGSIYSPTSYDPDNITIRDETYKPGVAQSTYDGTVETNFFGTIKDEDGCGVYTTLSFILDILSVGIGITAVIGIAIAGSTYLSSKGDVAKTTKAKRRIYEIVLGLIAYAVIYALLTFLTPEFNPELKVCKALTPEEVAQIKAENEARIKEAEEKQKAEEAGRTTKGSIDLPTDSGSVSTNIKGADLAGATAVGKKMLQAAEETAQYMAKNKFIYFQYDPSNGYYNKNIKKGYGPYKGEALTWDLAKKGRYSHCSSFVTLVEKKAGFLPDTRGYHSYILKGSIRFKNNNTKNKLLKNFKIVHGNGAKLSTLVNNKKIAPGDVFGYPGMTHTMIFAGKVDGKYWIYEVNAGNNKVLKYSGGLHKKISGSKKIGDILHAR